MRSNDPANKSLSGTVGNVLVDLGRFREAEPHLQRCLESESHQDQAIASYCLALVRESQNNLPAAIRLLDQTLVLGGEPWLLKRVHAKRAALKSPQPQNAGGV